MYNMYVCMYIYIYIYIYTYIVIVIVIVVIIIVIIVCYPGSLAGRQGVGSRGERSVGGSCRAEGRSGMI